MTLIPLEKPALPVDDRADMLAHAEEIARQAGRKMTAIRRHVYKCLLESEFPMGAYEILDQLDGVGARKPPTVYRALDWLMELGLIRKLSSVSKYVALPAGQTFDPVAMVLCRKCGRVDVLDVGANIADIVSAANSSGYDDVEATLEIMGQCQ